MWEPTVALFLDRIVSDLICSCIELGSISSFSFVSVVQAFVENLFCENHSWKCIPE